MDFGKAYNERLALALKELEQGEASLRDATAKLERRLNDHSRELQMARDFRGSNLLANRR